MKYIAVINVKDSITVGQTYTILERNDSVNMVKVKDDDGQLKWYSSCLFQYID